MEDRKAIEKIDSQNIAEFIGSYMLIMLDLKLMCSLMQKEKLLTDLLNLSCMLFYYIKYLTFYLL